MIYLYALSETDLFPFPRLTGLGGAPVKPVPLGELTLAVGEAKQAPACDLEALCQHEAAVEILSATRPILPFRFGTVVKDLEPVAAAVKARLTAILANLDRVSGCVELGLSVLPASGAEAPRARETSPGKETGRAYLERRRQEEADRNARLSSLRAAAEQLDERLQELSYCSRALPASGPAGALRFAYLVPWNAMPAFRTEVAAAQKDVEGRSATEAGTGAGQGTLPAFVASGPWPPYSFVKADLLAPPNEALPA